jgi:hypothetical protein
MTSRYDPIARAWRVQLPSGQEMLIHGPEADMRPLVLEMEAMIAAESLVTGATPASERRAPGRRRQRERRNA